MRTLPYDDYGYIIPSGTWLWRSSPVKYERKPQPRYDEIDTKKTGVYFCAFDPHFAKTMMTVRKEPNQFMATYITNRDIHKVSPLKYERQHEYLNNAHIEFADVVASHLVKEGDRPFAELFLPESELDALDFYTAAPWKKRKAILETYERRTNPDRHKHRTFEKDEKLLEKRKRHRRKQSDDSDDDVIEIFPKK
jgi:hypothetical protein